MATLALNSGLWVRRLLIGGSPYQGRYSASEVIDGTCPEKSVHFKFKQFKTDEYANEYIAYVAAEAQKRKIFFLKSYQKL